MTMRKLLYSLFALSLIVLLDSCAKNEQVTFTGEFIQLPAVFDAAYPRINDGVNTPSGFIVRLVGAQKSTPVNFSFEVVDTASTAIENLHYVVDANSGSIPANSNEGSVPISIIDDNINPGEVLSLVVRLTSADVALNDNYVRGDYTIQVTCDADLSTSVNFTNFDNFADETFTGEDEFRIFDNTPGVYVVDDFSFGSWPGAYGIDPPTGSLRFRENCGVISLSGTDNYGDTWSMTEIIESGGPNFTFKYENTYPEFGTVTLTKADGSDWPSLSL
jgi:hypothetical protein